MRKQIQEKLIKFATRVPVFMYLTDYRERSLRDVITQLEPGLFKKVTGLDVKDFEMLCSLGVFNASLMNDAIFKFKRYEDSSLSYTGIDKHQGEDIGGWDTVIRREEYAKFFYNQQATMENDRPSEEGPENDGRKEDPSAAAPAPVVTVRKAPSLVAEQYMAKPATAPKPPQEAPYIAPNVHEGDTVVHKTFGDGVVAWIDKAGKHIRVRFAAGEKTFIFPDAFQMGFLKMPEKALV